MVQGYMQPPSKALALEWPPDTPGTMIERLFPRKAFVEYRFIQMIILIHSHVTGYGDTESAPITRAIWYSHGVVGKPA